MRKELKILLTASAFSLLGAEMIGPVYAVFVEQIGGDLSTAGYAYGTLALVAGIVTFAMGHWADKLGHERKLIIFGYGVSTMAIFGYLFVSEPVHLYAVQVVLGLGSAIRTPSYDSLYSKYLRPGKYASEWGAWESMYWFVTAGAAVIGGWIAHTFGFDTLFMVMFVLAFLGTLSAGLLLRDHDKPINV